jgi:hypothetical protein
MQSTAQAAATAAGQSDRHIDFQVLRNDEAFWTIRPVSEKAKAAAAAELGLGDRSAQDLGIVVGYIRSNALLHGLRSRGFSILYHGPAGPITL